MAGNMKKIVNVVEDLTDERALGYAKANPDAVEYLPAYRSFVRKNLNRDKVFILGCGGSGVDPLYLGYIGYGGLDASCDGQVFTAPSAYSIYRLLHEYCNDYGAVLLSGNFDGDFMNDDMAIEMMALEGKDVLNILIRDDIGASIDDKSKRGGVAGLCIAIKMLGAASELGYVLEDFKKLKDKLENNLFTMTATLDCGSMPGTGVIMGTVAPGEVEFGKGFNGEKGIRTEPMMSADRMTDITLGYIINDMGLERGEDIYVLVSGQGAASLMELYLVMRRIGERMDEMGVNIYAAKVGDFHPPQETKGFSITFARLDKELKRLCDFPIYTPHFVSLKYADVESVAKIKYME